MKHLLKVLNIIALIAVAFMAGKMILSTEKQKVGEEHEEHGGHEEHGSEEDGHDHGSEEAGHDHGAEEAGHDEGDDGHDHGGHSGHGEEKADFVEITQEKAKNAGIDISSATPLAIETSRTLFGEFRANQENLAHIAPRFAGIIQQVNKRLGDHVEKGETLVVIESNESLETYEVKSLISGTIIDRNANRGEAVTEGQRLMTVADLSTLWVDLNAYPRDYHNLKIGQQVFIKHPVLGKLIESKIDYISPFGQEGTQTMLARATVPNPDGDLRPGLFAEGEIHTGKKTARVSVQSSALQTWEDKDVIFVWQENGFKAVPVTLGRSDGKHVEILTGMKVGDVYAGHNSFLLKAELGKDMAEHEH